MDPAPPATAEVQDAAMKDDPRIAAYLKYEAWIYVKKRKLDETKEDALDEVQQQAMKIVRKTHKEVQALFNEFSALEENKDLTLKYTKNIVDRTST